MATHNKSASPLPPNQTRDKLKHVTIPFTHPVPETRDWSADKLSIEINRLHDEISNSLQSGLDKAIRAGELLVALKAQLDHGNFYSYVRAKLRCSTRTASRYMALYHRQSELAGFTGVKEAQYHLEGRDGPDGELKRLRRNLVRPIVRVRQQLDKLRLAALAEHLTNLEQIRAELSTEVETLRNNI